MRKAYVSIGSNIDPEANIRGAVQLLEQQFGSLLLSSVYRTSAVGFDGEDFLNLAAGFSTELDAFEIRDSLHRIEDRCGRSRSDERFGPRTLDIDLLAIEGALRGAEHELVPRPEATQHAYNLAPLNDIAGTLTFDGSGLTVAELWAQLNSAQGGDKGTICRVDFDLLSGRQAPA